MNFLTKSDLCEFEELTEMLVESWTRDREPVNNQLFTEWKEWRDAYATRRPFHKKVEWKFAKDHEAEARFVELCGSVYRLAANKLTVELVGVTSQILLREEVRAEDLKVFGNYVGQLTELIEYLDQFEHSIILTCMTHVEVKAPDPCGLGRALDAIEQTDYCFA